MCYTGDTGNPSEHLKVYAFDTHREEDVSFMGSSGVFFGSLNKSDTLARGEPVGGVEEWDRWFDPSPNADVRFVV